MSLRRMLLAAIAALALFAKGGLAQEPAPANLSIPGIVRGNEPVTLTLAWRFHSGDDPRWSSPSFDDRSWAIADPQMRAASRPPGGWPGTGWFRRHVIISDDVPSRRVRLTVDAPGQATLYLDGAVIIHNAGSTSKQTDSDRPRTSGAWATVDLTKGPHLLAVRYVCDCASVTSAIGFTVSVDLPEGLQKRGATQRRGMLIFGAFIAIPAILGALHLALFLFYPKVRENLFCGLCMLSLALIIAASLAASLADSITAGRIILAVMYGSIAAATFFGLLTYAVTRTGRIPRTWAGFAIAGVLVPAVGSLSTTAAGNIGWTLYFVASLIEIVRIELKARVPGRESAFPLLIGMLVLDAAIAYQILILFRVVPPPFGFESVYLIGVLAFSLSTSLFVARSFARTSVHLEERLAEVEALSVQMIATERESTRRGVEIEAARTLQRSILPLSIPAVPGLDIAARVTMASEVGGDYYDFRAGTDDSITVAIGDAAGHGVAAGAMVIATKALFSSMADEESFPAILSKCDRVLRGMNIRPLHMCLLLAKVSVDGISVSSAAMPRPLHYRALTGAVEEIVVSGLPLAAALIPSWVEERETLAPGDVILFASDGLAESLSPGGDPLGYERVASEFAAAAPGAKAAAIIDSLMDTAESWRGIREQNDDIAMIVVRLNASNL